MNICMAGIDYKTAGIAMRGRFSPAADMLPPVLERVFAAPCVSGCVLLCTCNRTELYLSYERAVPDAAALLCEAFGLAPEEYRPYFKFRRGRAAGMHLMMTAAGLRSQVRGEDQILAQVKQAAQTARTQKTTGAALETLFRLAVTAAKKIKTEIPLPAVERSAAGLAVQTLAGAAGSLKGKNALVIGNGEMGKLAASLLMDAGCNVTMTVRSYKRGAAVIPAGCGAVPYDARYDAAKQSEILISATASPHFVIRAEDLRAPVPRYMIDLAVPRDIDPAVEAFPGVCFWNVDTLGGAEIQDESAEKLIKIKAILDEAAAKFEKWSENRVITAYSLPQRSRI